MAASFQLRSYVQPLYHVGYMEGKPWPTSSLEGPLLSCSICPEDWRGIAKLGGAPVWRIRCEHPLLLVDMLGLSMKKQQGCLEEACALGLIKQATLYRVDCSSDEEDEGRFMLFESRAEALENAEEGSRPAPVEGWRASPRLVSYWHGDPKRKIAPLLVPDAALVHLIELNSQAAGVWWKERHDPASLSAPRVGIFARGIRDIDRRERIIWMR
jgi:hypothetical protein